MVLMGAQSIEARQDLVRIRVMAITYLLGSVNGRVGAQPQFLMVKWYHVASTQRSPEFDSRWGN